MTRDEALNVIREMKSGMAFSDEENDVFWSYTFDPETNRFSYLEAWTVIGSILESRDYSEEEFTALLVADFDYAGVMHRAFSRGKVAAMDTPAPIKKDGEYHKHVFAAIETGDIKTLQLLLKSAEDLRSLVTEPKARSPLTLACMHGQLPIIQYLLGLGADVNQHDGHRETPVFVACNGYKSERIGEIVRLLFEAGAKVPQHEAGSDGAIHYAAMYGSFEAVKLLVEHGAPVNLAGSYGRTPLMYAAADAKSVETIELMLQSGADVNAVNEGGDNALFDAVTRENPSAAVAAKLLDAGLDLEYQHKSYKTILGWAASCGRREIVELLIARGAKVNADIERNESPIAQAMMNGHHEIVKLLLAAGADPESKNYAGWSLLEYATAKKDHDLVREIINRSTQKNNSGQKKFENKDVKSEALAKAAEQGDLTAMQLLVEQGADVNGLSRWGSETPLMKAAYYGQIEAAVWLLDHGADIEARDSRGNTALNHAAWTGKDEVVAVLVARGAEVNAVNRLNWNALMQAALGGHAACAKILLEHGSRTDLIDSEKGASVLYLAERSGSQALISLLKEHGAKPRIFRQRGADEPYLSITDCEYCQYIPQRKDLARDESMGDYPGLVLLHSQTTEVDRYATSTIYILQCKLCGTYYQNDDYEDTEDAFVAGPTIHRHLQRFNFERLKIAFAEHKMEKEDHEFSARQPRLIDAMKAALALTGSAIHPHFLPHYIENVTDSYIMVNNWDGLEKNLLRHSDKQVALEVAHDLVLIFGEGKYAVTGAEQPYRAYRHITPAVFNKTKKMLGEHRKAVLAILEAIRRLPEFSAAAKKVIESARYYKI